MHFGLDVRIDGEYADPRALVNLAVEAERAGWDGFFVQDAIVGEEAIVDPWVTLAAIATQTERIRIGVLLTALPRRRPWKVARETATLDHLSDGRLIFGAGSGYQGADFAAFGEDTDLRIRANKLDEGLEILSGLWTGQPFTFRGKYYLVDCVRSLPRPIQTPRIPIWIGGQWPYRRPFRRAARWDGIYVMTLKANGERLMPEEIREVVAYIGSHRANLDTFDVAFAEETMSDPKEGAELIQSYREAGVTWWLEGIWGAYEEMRERIRHGSPTA